MMYYNNNDFWRCNQYMGNFKSIFDELNNFDINNGGELVAGFDEVGRGSLAGPIVGACVIYKPLEVAICKEDLFYVRDSKTLSKSTIADMANNIKRIAIAYNIFSFSNEEIDKYGIQVCNRGLIDASINFSSEYGVNILNIDGTISPSIEFQKLVNWKKFPKADGKSLAVASASIIAKNYRDNLMATLPVSDDYGFAKNVGYGAKQHLDALKNIGATPYHRKTFISKLIVAGE